jgi:hypothetical protein
MLLLQIFLQQRRLQKYSSGFALLHLMVRLFCVSGNNMKLPIYYLFHDKKKDVVCMEFAGLPPTAAIQSIVLQVYQKIKVKGTSHYIDNYFISLTYFNYFKNLSLGIPLERAVLICTKPSTPSFLVDETVPFVLEMLQVSPPLFFQINNYINLC